MVCNPKVGRRFIMDGSQTARQKRIIFDVHLKLDSSFIFYKIIYFGIHASDAHSHLGANQGNYDLFAEVKQQNQMNQGI